MEESGTKPHIPFGFKHFALFSLKPSVYERVYVFLNDDHSIDLEFYQSIGEIEIVISQNGDVVYSSTENIDSPILRKVQLQKGLVGDFLLEIKGLDGAYAFGRFTIH